jgi:simple sugar transport system substrate-binding protein
MLSSRRVRLRTTALAAAGVIGVAAALSGCGGSSAGKVPTVANSSSGSASGGLIIDINGPLADVFFGSVKHGADAAAKQLGINYQYSAAANANNLGPDYARLMQQAIARHPAAMVVTDFVPSSEDALIKQATAAGIPVVMFNTDASNYQSLGAVGFVGELSPVAGHQAGVAASEAGIHHLVCVNHQPAVPNLHERCVGAAAAMRAAGGTSIELDLPPSDLTNPSAAVADIQGFMHSHPTSDGILTQSSDIATYALEALKNLGKTMPVGTFDLSTAVLQDIKSGKLAFAMDQQPYLEGYYSLEIAAQDMRYGLHPTSPIDTSGLIVNKSNVDQALKVQQSNPGLRGAE